jgi:hypothetical protein
MGAPRKADGLTPRHRRGLGKRRKSLRLDLRLRCYERLVLLARVDCTGRSEPLIGVIERLIEKAELPAV